MSAMNDAMSIDDLSRHLVLKHPDLFSVSNYHNGHRLEVTAFVVNVRMHVRMYVCTAINNQANTSTPK